MDKVTNRQDTVDLGLYHSKIVRGEFGADDGQADLGASRPYQQAQPEAAGSRSCEPILRLLTRVRDGQFEISAALGIQLRYAAAQSKIVVLANERLDSLEATPFDSLSVGDTSDTTTVEGFAYRRGSSVSAVSPGLYQIVVTLTPLSDGAPSYSATSYLSAVW